MTKGSTQADQEEIQKSQKQRELEDTHHAKLFSKAMKNNKLCEQHHESAKR
jgi:hypothetical protein